jgi:hypothetical protein
MTKRHRYTLSGGAMVVSARVEGHWGFLETSQLPIHDVSVGALQTCPLRARCPPFLGRQRLAI